ncbi:hypothetical protein Val02_77230 [Virgisporangium aliadipatigenens]|uniref:Uncharacterized protein n=1 Tax=Virgisporangium aliadipatigenens TaxID=741659 RepID=A0A8J3YUD9_9ACTN|nr:hypothetical protein Val02_77230 [Virgisporangium aliadipatigenens]
MLKPLTRPSTLVVAPIATPYALLLCPPTALPTNCLKRHTAARTGRAAVHHRSSFLGRRRTAMD